MLGLWRAGLFVATFRAHPRENPENHGPEQALKATRTIAENPYSVGDFEVGLVKINTLFPQQGPVEVWAQSLSSPVSSTGESSPSAVKHGEREHAHGEVLADFYSQDTIYSSENGYKEYGVPLEALPAAEKWEKKTLSPPEAIQQSLFNPIVDPDPRFKVLQLPSGGQAWIFTSSHSKSYWLQQCRQGIEYANSHMAASTLPLSGNQQFPSFVPISPNCPLVEKLILDTSFLGESIVLGAKRWCSIVSCRRDLYIEALGYKILKVEPKSTNPLPEWRPLSFATSTARLALLFLACVWVEASRSEHTCFDWETAEDLYTWVVKSDLKLKQKKGIRLGVVKWALATAKQGDNVQIS